jgi:hypothetical protein
MKAFRGVFAKLAIFRIIWIMFLKKKREPGLQFHEPSPRGKSTGP